MEPDGKTKLLIVDDLAENLQALNALIRADNREVYQAQSGEQALALLLQHEFALAILDVQMPGMDGFELAELMRGTERTRHIPIVFVSAAGRELNYAFKGYETGAVDFLQKPLDADAVKSKVNVFEALYQQRQEVRRQVEALEQARREQDALLHELHSTKDELERSLKMRDEFMSMVAHELRTPLNTLFLETQMRTLQLKRGNMAAFAKEPMELMIARDERQIQAMIRLIDDMLDVSRMRSGVLSIRPVQVEINGLVERVIGDLARRVSTAGTSVSFHPAPHAVTGWWDEFRIEQVIVNLLTNALRYGDGKPVDVRIESADDTVRVTVRDQGQGIAPEDQKRIFEPFERGKGNKVSGGLGLGLYISDQLARAHGGQLAVESKLGEGSAFSLTLPCRNPAS
ncbi:hybrid sensor histidine kinase/response regulator [Massilia arenosa]|uniref:histidine kinase n=1 Tax=Zemynaea arenosa TaxID=2561931 RepID=A0A4Y9S716_9BURK|nr:hybrid sensor histidine kinase/response regulator [Massilia arenosa]TFW15849.1 hybrid sensor histidine kinase/response regulator [Massilia arenosa]